MEWTCKDVLEWYHIGATPVAELERVSAGLNSQSALLRRYGSISPHFSTFSSRKSCKTRSDCRASRHVFISAENSQTQTTKSEVEKSDITCNQGYQMAVLRHQEDHLPDRAIPSSWRGRREEDEKKTVKEDEHKRRKWWDRFAVCGRPATAWLHHGRSDQLRQMQSILTLSLTRVSTLICLLWGQTYT